MSDQTIHSLTIHNLSEVIRLNPENITAYLNRGYVYWRQYYHHEAIADYDEAIRLDPENTIAYNNRGGVYRDIGDYDKAIADYDEAIRLEPEDATAYNNRGYAYGEKGDYDKAIADYDEAIRLDPENVTAYNNRRDAYEAKDDYDKAIADYDETIRLDSPDEDEIIKIIRFDSISSRAYDRREAAYRQKGNHDRVIAAHLKGKPSYSPYSTEDETEDETGYDYKDRFRKFVEEDEYNREILTYTDAIRLDPKNPTTYSNRGDVYFLKNDWDRAISDYTEAIRLAPGDVISYNNRGDAYYEKSNYNEAITDYDVVIRLIPEDDSADIREKRGDAYYQKGDYDKAIKAYNEVIYVNPGGAISAYAKRIDAYSKKLNIGRTSAVGNDAIRANLEGATAYHNKGYACYREGKYEEAISNYNEAIKLDTENAKIYVDRGDAYSKKCDIDLEPADSSEVTRAKNAIDLAIVDYDEAIRCNPGDVIAYFNRGRAYIKKSNIESATYNEIVTVDELNNAILRNPKNAIAYFSRGYTYSKQGSVNLAISDYENVVLCPNYKSDFVAAGFADGGEYAFEKALELLDSVISSSSEESAVDFYYLGVQSLFCLDNIGANQYFAKALDYDYHDQSKIEKYLENISKLEPQNINRRRGRGRTYTPAVNRRRALGWRRRYSLSGRRVDTPEELQYPEELQRLRLRKWKTAPFEKRHHYGLKIARYNEIIQRNPKDAVAYSKRGYAYFQRGEYDLAIADYDKVIQFNPKEITAYFNKSIAYQQKGFIDLHSSMGSELDFALLDEAIRFDPKSAEAYFHRAKAYFDKSAIRDYDRRNAYDDLELAIADYDAVLCLSPEKDTMVHDCHRYRAEAYHAIADNAYHELVRYSEAVEAYGKAIIDYNEAHRKYLDDEPMKRTWNITKDIEGSSYTGPYTAPLVNAYFCRGEIYAEDGNYDLAIADMSEVIMHERTSDNYSVSSKAAKAYNNRGFYYYKKGEYNEAIEDLQKTIKIYSEQIRNLGTLNLKSNPDFATMYLNLGSAYYAKMDSDMAIENYDNVVRNCPNYAKDFVDTNFAHGGKEEVHKAIKLLKSVVDNPTHPESFAAYYSGVLILFSGNKHKARWRFEKARELGFEDDTKITEHLENLRNRK